MEKIVCDLMAEIDWSCTNESLDSIVAGLDLKPEDNVLAICGSGDQAFAIGEYCRVLAVDRNPAQIDFARERLESLEEGDLNGFFKETMARNVNIPEHRNSYFSEDRLERIRESLINIELAVVDDLLDLVSEDFNKIYLSNLLFHLSPTALGEKDAIHQYLREVSSRARGGSVIYCAHAYQRSDIFNGISWPDSLTQDYRLTRNASLYTHLGAIDIDPIVLRKE